jgi:3,4-dihydroxy 2-butanone 4-phosphate synthase/GTP cyclohydrolase II
MQTDNRITEEANASLPTEFGDFQIAVFKDHSDGGREHVALTNLNKPNHSVLVRIHSCCLTGDVFHSLRCDCQKQLEYALTEIGKKGGMLLYLNQEGRGIGLSAKIKAYSLQEKYGLNTIEANQHLGYFPDAREYQVAALIIKHYNITSVSLLTNNPDKVKGLLNNGIPEVMRVEVPVFSNKYNECYLKVKEQLMGHIFKTV